MITPGHKCLITCDDWFYAPDGRCYKAVFGTVHAIVDAETALGIKTNRNSTNWYVAIGDAIIAGCQIHYAVRTDTYNPEPDDKVEVDHNGERCITRNAVTRIYDADASGLSSYCGAS